MLDALHRERAGRAAGRRYKELSKAWRHRFFGRRFTLLVWLIYALVFVVIVDPHLGARASLYAGVGFGVVAASFTLMPEALMPEHISRWQRGMWGEQMTERELKQLTREGWSVRHALRWTKRADHDHLVCKGAVFVLNSKNVKDSKVTVEGNALRVSHLEGEDSYLADRWVPCVAAEARSLKIKVGQLAGTSVYVYPVLVIWGEFAAKATHIGDVAVVRGDFLADWLRSQPVDLLTAEKRQSVADAVRALPNA